VFVLVRVTVNAPLVQASPVQKMTRSGTSTRTGVIVTAALGFKECLILSSQQEK